VSSLRIYVPKDLRPLDNRQSVAKSINEVHKRFDEKEGGIPLLDPIEDLNIDDPDFKKMIRVCNPEEGVREVGREGREHCQKIRRKRGRDPAFGSD
jgi:hypothetical protein